MKGFNSNELAVVYINVDELIWTDEVNFLILEHDW